MRNPRKRGVFIFVEPSFCALTWVSKSDYYFGSFQHDLVSIRLDTSLSDIERNKRLRLQVESWGTLYPGGWVVSEKVWKDRVKIIRDSKTLTSIEIEGKVEEFIRKNPRNEFVWLYDIEELLTHSNEEMREVGHERLRQQLPK